jgi:branched-chain amino acid transport system substrate-binding protein
MHRWFLSRRLGLAAAGLVTALIAACGASGQDTSGTGGEVVAGDDAAREAGVTDYLAYVGGKAGTADTGKEAVGLGWVNVEGGAVSFPEATFAAKAAVKYVNDKLGGVGGRPLELRTCAVAGAEEEGQKCGQRLVNDRSVVAIGVGNLFVGNTTFTSVVNGQKPVLAGVGTGPAMSSAKNTFLLFGDLAHVFGPWGTYARDTLKAKTVALVHTNTPGDQIASTAVREGLERAGLKVKTAGFDAQATDLLGPVTAAGAQTADMVVPITSGQGCVGVAKALKQLAVTRPVVATPICLSADVAQGLGGDLPEWTYGIAQTLPADTAAPDARAFMETSARYGLGAADAAKVFSPLAWSTVLTFVKAANAAGADTLTSEAVTEQLKKFNGPVIMGAPGVSCGMYPDAAAVCNDRAKFYQYKGKGQFVALTSWLKPPS